MKFKSFVVLALILTMQILPLNAFGLYNKTYRLEDLKTDCIPIIELVSDSGGNIEWDLENIIAKVSLEEVTYGFKINTDHTVDLLKEGVNYGKFDTEDARYVMEFQDGRLNAGLYINRSSFNRCFDKLNKGTYTKNDFFRAGDERLSDLAKSIIVDIENQYGNLTGNVVPRAEAELVRTLDKAVKKHKIRGPGNKYNIKTTLHTIMSLQKDIDYYSKTTGIPREMVSSILFREMMCIGIDDVFDGINSDKNTKGIGQLSVAGVRINENKIEELSQGRRPAKFKNIKDYQLNKMLLDPGDCVYFTSSQLKARAMEYAGFAYEEEIDIYDENSIKMILAEYNQADGKAIFNLPDIYNFYKDKITYGEQVYEYYKAFREYYRVVSANKVVDT
ncbi:MAG: hypothetical protein ACOYWZ_11700 [Bacillota bacterium]